MSKFLFVVPPVAGHVNPAGAVARALADQGHDVAWAGPETTLRRMLGDETVMIYGTGMRPYRGQRDRGLRAIKSVWEGFLMPYARFTLPAVEKAVLAFEPDVVVVDQVAPAGAVAAHRHGVRWASLAPQMLELSRPFRHLPKVDAWIRTTAASLSADGPDDPRFSPYLQILLTTRELFGHEELPEHTVLVGPVLTGRPEPDFPWEALDGTKHQVVVTMGTLADDLAREFYPRMAGALRMLGDRVQAIVTAPPDAVPDPPPQTIVAPRVPFLALMSRLSAAVCHGGMNTVSEMLAHGVPLVIAPIKHDQPMVANRVAAAGAGVRVRFGRSSAEELRDALATVLDDPAYRTAATGLASSFTEAGGAPAAATHLIALATSGATSDR
ncbi:glycosyltransferase [Phytohabitans rumicis]|uniref:Glycosyl transferase n=1 Tax=Phytohabitans rumicis TaxID=1076125 RepID=A0A6V8KS23_9ACTN|nr:nucleotide disphospho-sugar-binding domain-containing protein [Phytohabitans rumicis]GFJ87943.1 glycosyl transferase [Phytohabitans rumicis]